MSHKKLVYLLDEYLSGNLTEQVRQELSHLLDDPGNQQQLADIIDHELASGMYTGAEDQAKFELIHRNLLALCRRGAGPKTPVIALPGKSTRTWQWLTFAASVLLVFAAGAYIWLSEKKVSQKLSADVAVTFERDIQPGDNRATLTLGDGRIITLDRSSAGSLPYQGSARITKLENGKLAYSKTGMGATAGPPPALIYNTISTPRGGQYQVVLADGSKVWLNAASSIRFPAVFNGEDRKVEIAGEAYFEIAPDSRPFLVAAHGTVIRVLGTRFNINAYSDEDILKTTLLEGSLQVVHGPANLLMKPGEQVGVKEGALRKMPRVNTSEEVAWKDGLFKFNNLPIGTIMRQISRWYNVDILFEGEVTEHFVSTIPRDVPLSQVLKALQMTGEVNFQIRDNQVVVKP